MKNINLKNYKLNPYLNLFFQTPKYLRIKYIQNIFLISLVGTLEIFSLSSLLYFIQKSFLNFNSSENINLIASNQTIFIFVILIFSIKSFFILMVGKFSYQLALETKKSFQDLIFSIFLRLPYSSQANNQSSDWIRILTVDSYNLEGRLFTPILVLFGEIIPSLCICIFLLNLNYQIFILLFFIFLIVGLSLYKSNNKKLVKLGEKQQFAEGSIVSLSQQAYLAIKELRIYNLRQVVYESLKKFTNQAITANIKALFLGLIPRFAFELSIYLSLGLLFFVYQYQGKTIIDSLGEILVFMTAAIRLLPSVSKILSHLQSIKHAKASVISITNVLSNNTNLGNISNNSFQKMKFESLHIENISFSYNNLYILKNINFKIKHGEKIAFIGPSGSGKTTLLNLILGLLIPLKGKIFLNGNLLTERNEKFWHSIGYVPQEPFLFNSSLKENIILNNKKFSKNEEHKFYNLMTDLDLPPKLFESTKSIGENGCMLSGGQKQRLSIARALWREPEILFLDESTSSLDKSTQSKIMNTIFKIMKDKTIIMISHRLETIKNFDKVISLPNCEVIDKKSIL